MHEINALWIPILGIMMPIVLVPMIMILKHRTFSGSGSTRSGCGPSRWACRLPSASPAEASWPSGRGCRSRRSSRAVDDDACPTSRPRVTRFRVLGIVWGCAFMISAIRDDREPDPRSHQTLAATEKPASLHAMRNGKPAFDPDAFDVVSSRG